MTFRLKSSRRFERQLRRFLRRHPELRERVDRTFRDLEQDPFQPHLHLHPLHGELQGFHAVRVDYSTRIVLVLEVEDGEIRLVDIGSHDQVCR